MSFENDMIMRQIHNMCRMLANMLLNRSKADYEYDNLKEAEARSDRDELYDRLVHLVNNGEINEAENILSDYLESDIKNMTKVALGFYSYLDSLDDSFLNIHNFSREEVRDGIKYVATLNGLGEIVE